MTQPTGIADHIIASAHIQNMLQSGTTFLFADAIKMFVDFTEQTTSYPAITDTPMSPGTNTLPGILVTIPMLIGLERMDVTSAYSYTSCYHFDAFGHEVNDAMTLDPREHS